MCLRAGAGVEGTEGWPGGRKKGDEGLPQLRVGGRVGGRIGRHQKLRNGGESGVPAHERRIAGKGGGRGIKKKRDGREERWS